MREEYFKTSDQKKRFETLKDEYSATAFSVYQYRFLRDYFFEKLFLNASFLNFAFCEDFSLAIALCLRASAVLTWQGQQG